MLKKNNLLLFGLLCMFSFFAFSFYLFHSSITTTLNRWDLLPRPETFTELYFEDHEHLPTEVIPEKQYVFSFSVHNLEYKNMTYPYNVYLLTGDKKEPLQNGKISLQQNQKRSIPVRFRISTDSVGEKSKLVVNLSNKHEYIAFWINE